jgi:hypothetical protein
MSELQVEATATAMAIQLFPKAGARVELPMIRKCCKDHFVWRRARWLENEGDINGLR